MLTSKSGILPFWVRLYLALGFGNLRIAAMNGSTMLYQCSVISWSPEEKHNLEMPSSEFGLSALFNGRPFGVGRRHSNGDEVLSNALLGTFSLTIRTLGPEWAHSQGDKMGGEAATEGKFKGTGRRQTLN